MKTFNRICIEDYSVSDGENTATVERGKEYITSEEEEGMVTVFTNFWFTAPVNVFAGEKEFTNT